MTSAQLPKAAKMQFESRDIDLTDILLDPNNYRFLDSKGFKPKPQNRYASDKVQAATLRILSEEKRYQLDELRNSILTNGYIPMERIIVVPYEFKSGTFLVVEGNRRVAALKSLIKDNDEEVLNLTGDQVDSFKKIPCAILVVDKEHSRHAERVIMGIRHITGPREWGAYQQAQLIQQLHDEESQDFASIAQHLGLSTVEVSRRYRAMNALKAMESDELYSDKAEPEFYRLFHELVSLPEVRKRFGWDPENDQFTASESAREFFELIAPQTKETAEAKLKSFSDVRKLKYIIGNPTAEEVLLDPTKTFAEAINATSQHKPAAQVQKEPISLYFKGVLTRIREMTRQELKDLTEADKATIKAIVEELKDIVK
jgi:hypothetical protein